MQFKSLKNTMTNVHCEELEIICYTDSVQHGSEIWDLKSALWGWYAIVLIVQRYKVYKIWNKGKHMTKTMIFSYLAKTLTVNVYTSEKHKIARDKKHVHESGIKASNVRCRGVTWALVRLLEFCKRSYNGTEEETASLENWEMSWGRKRRRRQFFRARTGWGEATPSVAVFPYLFYGLHLLWVNTTLCDVFKSP